MTSPTTPTPSKTSNTYPGNSLSHNVREADPSVKTAVVTDEDRFLFDLQGFILLRGAMAQKDVKEMLAALHELEAQKQDDSHWRKPRPDGKESQATRQEIPGQLRINGLLRLSNAFDRLIDYPSIFPYLQAFMNRPQIGNTWSISKSQGTETGSWHRGTSPDFYTVRNGTPRTRMFNTVYFLTDNHADGGGMATIPGGHKSNFDLDWGKYKGTDLPGSATITGKAGDVLIFSESLLHTGLAHTRGERRSNLYFNYTSIDYNIATFSPQHNYHFAMPPHVRDRFTPARKQASEWMEYIKTID